MKEKEWKREKTDRERTDMLLSLGVNNRSLSSQCFAVYAEATGDPWMCMLFVTVRQSCAHLHTTLSFALYIVFACSWVYIYLYVAQWEHLSIEKDWSFHGTWGMLVSMSRLGAKL